MITILVASFMWVLVLVLALRARTRPDNTMFRAAIVIAFSLTTNVSEIYLWVSAWLPWPNALDLVANVLLIVGVYYLSRAIASGATRARAGASGRVRNRWVRRAAVLTVTIMVASFALIDNPEPSTAFMLTYGEQVAAGIYSAVQYLYILAVMAGTLVTCIRNVPRMRQGRFRVGFTIIGVGCGFAVLLCMSVLTMDAANILREESLLQVVGTIYDYLFLITILLLCTGLGCPPLGRVLNSLSFRRRVSSATPKVRSIWVATVAKNPSLSVVGSAASMVAMDVRSPSKVSADELHRMVIEIHDWANLHSHGSEALSEAEWATVREAEVLCLQQGRTV